MRLSTLIKLVILNSVFFFFGFSQKGNSQKVLSSSSEISLITCRPGDQLYNLFGHTSIKVSDPDHNKIEYFNYGLFNFREPGFLQKFLRGKLLYQLGIESQQSFLPQYSYAKRSVLEQVMSLDSIQKQNIYNALIKNYKPENRSYLYDFFFDNCSTRPRDIILDNVPELDILETKKDNPTFRHLLDRYTFSSPWTDFGIDLIIGSVADQKAAVHDQMFLPELLFQHFAKAKKDSIPFISKEILVLNHEDQIEKRAQIPWLTPSLFFAFLLGFELFLFYNFRKAPSGKLLKVLDNTWFALLGIGSLVLLFMWFGTDHIATKDNLNCLWMHILFLFIAFNKNKVAIIISAILMIFALILSPFIQDIHVASLLIITITLIKLARTYLMLNPLLRV